MASDTVARPLGDTSSPLDGGVAGPPGMLVEIAHRTRPPARTSAPISPTRLLPTRAGASPPSRRSPSSSTPPPSLRSTAGLRSLYGWLEADQMETNRAMLANCLDALEDHPARGTSACSRAPRPTARTSMRMRVPGREREPRVEHPNFYWLQEDLLRAPAERRGFAFTIWRPPVIVGHALGAPMNVLAVLGGLCRHRARDRRGLRLPRRRLRPHRRGRRAPARRGHGLGPRTQRPPRRRTFNVSNGDVLHWPDLWPALADAFGVESAPTRSRAPSPTGCRHAADVWDAPARAPRPGAPELADFVGDSAIYADMLFGHGRDRRRHRPCSRPSPCAAAGFADCIDSEDMFRDLDRRACSASAYCPADRVAPESRCIRNRAPFRNLIRGPRPTLEWRVA